MIDLVDFWDKEINIVNKLLRINIIDQIDVYFMLTQKSESTAIMIVLDHLENGFEQDNPRAESFKISSRHLHDRFKSVDHYESSSSFNSPNIEVALIV